MANPDTPKFITNGMLKEIRDNTDWRELFWYLGLERDRKSTEQDWWAESPLNPGEKSASFHMNDHGWTCFSTNESGYVIELVQEVVGQRTGRVMNCYEAGKWLLENGLSRVTAGSQKSSVPQGEQKKGSTGNIDSNAAENHDGQAGETEKNDTAKKENVPIRQTLLPALDTGHPGFGERGISQGTCLSGMRLSLGAFEKPHGRAVGIPGSGVRGGCSGNNAAGRPDTYGPGDDGGAGRAGRKVVDVWRVF
jgi:hypothetical protein